VIRPAIAPETEGSPPGMILMALDLAVELVGALVEVVLPVIVAVVPVGLLVEC
jgi:hypothetical protein